MVFLPLRPRPARRSQQDLRLPRLCRRSRQIRRRDLGAVRVQEKVPPISYSTSDRTGSAPASPEAALPASASARRRHAIPRTRNHKHSRPGCFSLLSNHLPSCSPYRNSAFMQSKTQPGCFPGTRLISADPRKLYASLLKSLLNCILPYFAGYEKSFFDRKSFRIDHVEI